VLGKGPPLPEKVAREFKEARDGRESAQAETRRAQYRRHAKTGAIMFCAIGVIIFFAQFFLSFAAGMTGRAPVDSLTLRLVVSFLLIPVYAALLGAPMSVLISRQKMGFFASGALGAAGFLAFYFLLGMNFMFGPVQTPFTIFAAPVFGFVYGAALSVHIRVSSQN
jgi:hypothetical protein